MFSTPKPHPKVLPISTPKPDPKACPFSTPKPDSKVSLLRSARNHNLKVRHELASKSQSANNC